MQLDLIQTTKYDREIPMKILATSNISKSFAGWVQMYEAQTSEMEKLQKLLLKNTFIRRE